LGRC